MIEAKSVENRLQNFEGKRLYVLLSLFLLNLFLQKI